jgi:hypothetical protein
MKNGVIGKQRMHCPPQKKNLKKITPTAVRASMVSVSNRIWLLACKSVPSVFLARALDILTMFDNPKLLLVILGVSAAVVLASFILVPTGAATVCSRYGQTVGGVKQKCTRCSESSPCQCGGGGGKSSMSLYWYSNSAFGGENLRFCYLRMLPRCISPHSLPSA